MGSKTELLEHFDDPLGERQMRKTNDWQNKPQTQLLKKKHCWRHWLAGVVHADGEQQTEEIARGQSPLLWVLLMEVLTFH